MPVLQGHVLDRRASKNGLTRVRNLATDAVRFLTCPESILGQ